MIIDAERDNLNDRSVIFNTNIQNEREVDMAVDLVVRDGLVVTPTNTFNGGVAIKDGLIVAIGTDSVLPDAERVLDVRNKYILPGLMDPHVHFRDPGVTYKEDFTSGSTAAVFGGITSVLDMPNVIPIMDRPDRLLAREKLIRERSYVDIMLVGVVVQDNPDQIIPMAKAGAAGFKIFLGSTTGNISAPDDGAGGRGQSVGYLRSQPI